MNGLVKFARKYCHSFSALKTGKGREDECLPCPAGKYCRNYGVIDFTSGNGSGLCHAGYFCKTGVNTPTPSSNFTGKYLFSL